MENNNLNKKILVGAFVGTVTGAAVMMFDRKTRENVMNMSKQYSQNTVNWIKHVKENPHEFLDNVKNGLDQISRSFKEVSEDLQHIFVQLGEVKEMSTNALETAKSAGQDVKEIGSSLVNLNSSSESNLGLEESMGEGENYPKLH